MTGILISCKMCKFIEQSTLISIYCTSLLTFILSVTLNLQLFLQCDKRVLSFPIQVVEFVIAFLEIVNILRFLITSVAVISITFMFDFLSTNDRNLSNSTHVNLSNFFFNLSSMQIFKFFVIHSCNYLASFVVL